MTGEEAAVREALAAATETLRLCGRLHGIVDALTAVSRAVDAVESDDLAPELAVVKAHVAEALAVVSRAAVVVRTRLDLALERADDVRPDSI